MKPVLISGIQPSGRLHIGNYLGALKNFVELQNSDKYECYFFVADLHSLTEKFDPKERKRQILELTADFIAAGLDPKKSVIFQQSQVSAHSELAWIFNTITPMGELSRMTQFKDKSQLSDVKALLDKNMSDTTAKIILKEVEELNEVLESGVNMGLFDYPVLMAADILLYNAKFVPVGHDQLQHLELTRTLARKFNSKFGETFNEPEHILTSTPRVMSLLNPQKKMSKSQPEGCLFLDDSPEEIKKKIGRAVTDSGSEITYEPKNKPGLGNLLDIYSSLTYIEPALIAKEFAGKKYSDLKKSLTEVITDYFADFREKKTALIKKPNYLKKVIISGSKQAAKVANKKISEVKEKIGVAI